MEVEHSSIKVTVMSWLTDDRSRLKDTLCSHFPSSKIVNLGRFNFQLEPITISREVFLPITEPRGHCARFTATKQRKIKTNCLLILSCSN